MPIASVLLGVIMGVVNICTGMCAFGSDDVCSLCMPVLLRAHLGVEHAHERPT